MSTRLFCLFVPLALACTPASTGLVCGPGTIAEAGECVPDPDESSGGDAGGSDDGGDDGSSDDGSSDDGSSDDTASTSEDDTGTSTGGDVAVYLLGGQSNMVGYGQSVALPPSLRLAQDDVWIYWSGYPAWRGLQASSDLSSGSGTWFGPEVTFGRALADAQPADEVFLIKHAVGGTDLAEYWYPGEHDEDPAMGAGYAVWLSTVRAALVELEALGLEPEVRGMIWMQGESDATSASWASAYADNLRHLVARVREDTAQSELPFAAAEIDCRGLCDYRDTVNAAMEEVAAEDAGVFTVPTEDLGTFPNDGWHYQGTGQRVLGERFAAALLGQEPPPLPQAAVEITGTYTWSYTGDYTVGWSFSTNQDLIITDLGQFDLGSDGLAHATTVGIWEADTASLLVTGIVPEASAGDSPFIGGWRYTGIEPFALPAGDYIIGLEVFGSSPDVYIYGAQIGTGSELSWTSGWHQTGASLSFPVYQTESTTDSALWFGPNFRYMPAG